MIKIAAYTVTALGFLLVLGVAGADCDGKCMENSLSLSDIMLYTAIGFTMMISGAIVAVRSE